MSDSGVCVSVYLLIIKFNTAQENGRGKIKIFKLNLFICIYAKEKEQRICALKF